MLEITENHLEIFKQIKDRFLPETDVPEQDSWKSWTNDKIWIEMIKQIMVIQSKAENVKENFDESKQSRVSYEKLIQVVDESEIQGIIQQVLTEVDVNYPKKKAKALVYNLKQLKSKYDDPKGLFKKLSRLSDKEKIELMTKKKEFDQIGLKGARDYLMEAGLILDAIAFDTNIKKILRKAGIKLPEKFETNLKKYAEVEKDVLEKICKPLGLLGVEFDRMLFQNKEEILKML